MRTKNLFINLFVLIIKTVFSVVIGVILPKIYISTYGSEVYGAIGSITTIVNYFTLIEMGFGGAMLYALYKPIADNDEEGINSVVNSAGKAYKKMGLILMTLVVSLACVYPLIVDSQFKYITLSTIVIVLGLPVIIDFFIYYKFLNLINAYKKLYIISLANLLEKIFTFIFIYLLAKQHLNVVFILCVPGVFSIIRVIVILIYIQKKFPFIKSNQTDNTVVIKSRRDTVFTAVAAKMQYSIPIIVATLIASLEEVSVMTVYNMILIGVGSILSLVSSPSYSIFGEIIAKESKEKFQNTFSDFEGVYFFIVTIVFSATIILLQSFIKIYTQNITDVNYDNFLFGILFTISFLIDTWRIPFEILVNSGGLYREARTINIIYSVFVFGLTTLFGLLWGLNGIAIGMIVSNLYRLISFIWLINRLKYYSKVKQTYKRLILSTMVLILNSLVLIVMSKFKIDGYVLWILMGTIVFIASSFITIIANYIFDKPLIVNLRKRIITLINKKTAKTF